MTVVIEKSVASGRVTAPPSKSMAHRYLICGGLSDYSEISGVSLSDDIKATLGGLYSLGADVEIEDDTVKLGGIDFNKKPRFSKIDCIESGSTLRFLIPLCLLFDSEITLFGSERLFERSLLVYEQICTSQGIKFIKTKNSVTVKGRLSAGKYTVRGDISSQFISGLMFALSQLEADSTIEITGNLESASYLTLTIKALGKFGVRISRIDERTIYIKGNQKCKNRTLTVEGDYSNAAFLDAFNLLGGNVAVRGLSKNTAQGDSVYKELFLQLQNGRPTIDITDCPDLAPILMAVAANFNGATFTGTKRLKIKESDRGEAMKSELAKFGCRVITEQDKITVYKSALKPPKTSLLSHNDHRIVMALSVLASVTGGEILGAEAVAKSFPDFFDKISKLDIKVKTNETD